VVKLDIEKTHKRNPRLIDMQNFEKQSVLQNGLLFSKIIFH